MTDHPHVHCVTANSGVYEPYSLGLQGALCFPKGGNEPLKTFLR